MLIKIMSGYSHMLILGALKTMPTPLHARSRWGEGDALVCVSLHGRGRVWCVCVCV